MNADLWLNVLLAPLAGIVVLLVVGRKSVPWLWLSCVPALLAAIWPPGELNPGYLWPAASWGAPDPLARGWLGFTALLWGCATAGAAGIVDWDKSGMRFWLFWLFSLSGNLLLVIGKDAISFYMGFTIMSIAAYGLVVHHGGPGPRRAGRIYLQLAITGEMILLAAFVMRAQSVGGSLALADWQQLPIDGFTLAALVLGFGLKIGFWPLHVWLPLAHPAAPSPASAVLSGAMIEAGILGLWRALPADDSLLQSWAGPLLALGLFSAFYGVLLGLITSQVKAALAYSSVSQMGYFLVILALAWRHPEQSSAFAILLVLFAAHHGIAKGALFLGTSIHPLHRWTWLVYLLPALAISGLPLTSGGAVKGDLKHWISESDFSHLSGVFKLATAGTTLLLARALWLLRRADAGTTARHRSGLLLGPWTLLCLSVVLVPLLWPGFREVWIEQLSWSTTWQLLWPMAAAIALTGFAIKMEWRVPEPLRRWYTPVLPFSLRLKRWLYNPPLPRTHLELDWRWWRQQERRWNHFWNERGIISSSGWLLGFILLAGVIWSAFW
ncbi:sodium:proton antiporter [Proteobacteria bacterium 005FR1]|nr:sodium:proton antiporter [Proteobacteria bacterium 005FR1]